MARVKDSIELRSRQAASILSRCTKVAAVYVFGSQVEGKADVWSDIDLAVFLENAGSLDIFDRARLSANIQKEAGDDIELHFFSAKSLNEPDPASFAAYVKHHGVQINFLEGES